MTSAQSNWLPRRRVPLGLPMTSTRAQTQNTVAAMTKSRNKMVKLASMTISFRFL